MLYKSEGWYSAIITNGHVMHGSYDRLSVHKPDGTFYNIDYLAYSSPQEDIKRHLKVPGKSRCRSPTDLRSQATVDLSSRDFRQRTLSLDPWSGIAFLKPGHATMQLPSEICAQYRLMDGAVSPGGASE